MRKLQRVLWVGSVLLLVASNGPAIANATGTPPAMATPVGLSFAEIKITGDEFLVLQNNSDKAITDLSSYWLQDYNNVNPMAAGVSNSSQQLPAVPLGVGQTLLLSSATQPTCGAAVAGKLNVSLTDGGGFLELVQVGQNSSGAVTQTPGDVVSWSSGASGNIQNVPSSTKDPKAAWYRYQAAAGYAWQQADVDTTNACQLNVVVATGTPVQPVATTTLAQAGTSPPATIINLATDTSVTDQTSGPVMPTADIGLLAPQLSEILPNPNGTGTDSTDEFIELYNPNDKPFDLSGFTLRTGTTTTHSYVFPSGTVMPGSSFTAFYAEDTSLSMSNSGGQAVLLDPFGNSIGQTDGYGVAKDGQAWAIANGKWYWTIEPTPGAANIITQPVVTKPASSSKAKTKSSTATKSSSKTKGVKGAATTVASSNGNTSGSTTAAEVTPVHPWTLALVALAALLYGAYEYRIDLANRIYQFRKNRAARRVAGA